MRRFSLLIVSLVLAWSLVSVSMASADVKLIVIVHEPEFVGSTIKLTLTLKPFGQDVRAVQLPPIARSAVTPSTSPAVLKAFIIARVQTEYSVTLTDEEIWIFGGLQ